MIETIYKTLINKALSPESIVFIMSFLPISELRGAIPVGLLKMHLPLLKTYFIAVAGNMVPVIPLLLLLEPLSNKLRTFKVWAKFFDWLFARTRKKAKLVERFEALGLMLFVCVPLPVTGAWTGCIAAVLFKIPVRVAFCAILLGVMIAGVIVTLLTTLTTGITNGF
ncbi:MAG: small multi-drug export protein [Candidatus Omnitrophota bacterium]